MAQEKIIVMTDEQLNKLLDEVAHKDSDKPNQGAAPRRYVYGLRGIRDLFGVSHTTAQRYKNTFLAPAISQRGRKIIVDVEKALQLFDQFNGVAVWARNQPRNPAPMCRNSQTANY